MKRFLTGRRRAALAAAVMSALILGGSLPAVAMAALPPINFSVTYGESCISGRATLGSTVNVSWRDSAGALKAAGSILTQNGFWELCGDGSVFAAIGDRLHAADGTSTRKYVLPNFSVAADRVNNVFRGTGPANRTLTISYQPGRFADYEDRHFFRPGDDGTWTFNPPEVEDIEGGQFVSLYWRSPNHDNLQAYASAASVTLVLGRATFLGATTPLAEASFTLRNASTNVKLAGASASADPRFGDFQGTFRDSGGQPVAVVAGQRFKALSFAADANWIVPNITGTADKVADTVAGRCYDTGKSSGNFIVRVNRTGNVRGYAFGHANDPDGSFTIDFSDPHESPGYEPANIKTGDRIEISCMQTTGDWVRWSFRVP
jgi:hypothetical protein